MVRGLLFAVVLAPTVAGGDELRVGMETRQAPWCYVPGAEPDTARPPSLTVAQARHLVGFDVDVVQALARRLGVRTRVVPTAWHALERGLVDGRFDVILSSWTPSPSTPVSIVASPPYYEWGLLVVVRDGSPIRSLTDVPGARVGFYEDPAVAKALEAMGQGHFEVRDSQEELFRNLRSGALDAVIYDSLHVRWRVAHEPGLRIVGEPLNRLGYHVGMRRRDAALVERVNAAVKALVASEEMAAIKRKWEGR